jgi:hypothetical protein
MPEKFKRAVRKLAKKPGIRNAYAVATAANIGNIKQVRKREAKKRRAKKGKR